MIKEMYDIIVTKIVTRVTKIVNLASKYYFNAYKMFVISKLRKLKSGTEIANIKVCQFFSV